MLYVRQAFFYPATQNKLDADTCGESSGVGSNGLSQLVETDVVVSRKVLLGGTGKNLQQLLAQRVALGSQRWLTFLPA